MKEIIENVQRTIRNWWVGVVVGILSICLGIYCCTIPAETFTGLSVMFEVFFFAAAVLELFFAISNSGSYRGWGWALAGGIIDFILGVLLLMAPPAAAGGVMVLLLAFWLIFRAVWGIGASVELSSMGVRGWGWWLVLSILTMCLAIWFLYNPLVGAGVIVWIFATALIVYGCFRIGIGLRLNRIRKDVKEIRNNLENGMDE